MIADRQSERRRAVEAMLDERYLVAAAGSAVELTRAIDRDPTAVVVLDVAFFGAEAQEALTRLRAAPSAPDVIVLCNIDEVSAAVSAMRCGACDFTLRGHEAGELEDRIARVLRRRQPTADAAVDAGGRDLVLGHSPAMRRAFDLARRIAPLDVPVLLLGETGVGKEVFARLVHGRSRRASSPFVPVNLAAIPCELVESTLFGHERGAFTGAVARQTGKLALAQAGTLFLDEIGDMRVDLQAKLLRAIQEREIEPVGGRGSIPVDVRLVSATNVDLAAAVAAGSFRKDLYYRLNVVAIRIPPLRERREDIEGLVRHFVGRYGHLAEQPVRGVSPAAIEVLTRYEWPGNVRELENKVQRAVALSTGPVLGPADFFDLEALEPERFLVEQARDLRSLESLEEAYIKLVLMHTGNHQGEAARVLGIDRKTLYNKLVRYGLLGARGADRKSGDDPGQAAAG